MKYELGYQHRGNRKVRRLANAMDSARQCLPENIKGLDAFYFTAGQWSLMEMLCALLERMGSAKLTASVWTAADADMRDAYDLIDQKRLTGFRLYVDRSFQARQPEYAELALKLFGADAICITRTHCKVAVLENDEYCFVLRGSMNLNHSPRWEQLEITDDREFGKFIKELLETSRAIGKMGLDADNGVIQDRLYAPFEK